MTHTDPDRNGYIPPTPFELRALLRAWNLSGARAGELLGGVDGRQIRRWTSGTSPMPFACLYTLTGRACPAGWCVLPSPETWREDVKKALQRGFDIRAERAAKQGEDNG